MRYILNSAVITSFGAYEYAPMSVQEAADWILENNPISTVAYAETCEAFSSLLGIPVPLDEKKTRVSMQAGDTAVVLRLTSRILPEMKGKLGEEWILENSEIGFLKRIR